MAFPRMERRRQSRVYRRGRPHIRGDHADFVLGLVIFFGIHSVRIIAGFRDAQVAASERRWKGLYSLVSIAGFVLIVWGWRLYRPEAPKSMSRPWGRHLTALLVLLAFIAFAASFLPGRYQAAAEAPDAGRHHALVGRPSPGQWRPRLEPGLRRLPGLCDRRLVAVIPRGDPAPVVVQARSDLIAAVVGIVAFAVFGLWLHGWLFGVSPFA